MPPSNETAAFAAKEMEPQTSTASPGLRARAARGRSTARSIRLAAAGAHSANKRTRQNGPIPEIMALKCRLFPALNSGDAVDGGPGIENRPVFHDELCRGQLTEPRSLGGPSNAFAGQTRPRGSGLAVGEKDVRIRGFRLAEVQYFAVVSRVERGRRACGSMENHEHRLAGYLVDDGRLLLQLSKWIYLL